MIRLDAARLAPVMREALAARDVDPTAIDHVVDSLVQTSLRGVDSHGINLFPHYCRVVESGRVNRRPSPTMTNTAAATAILDADHAFGHHVGALAIDHAVALAHDTGAVSYTHLTLPTILRV